MARFENTSSRCLSIFNKLIEYDSWLDEISSIADMGCGECRDIDWWANLYTRDDPPAPHNYLCYAVDHKPSVIPYKLLPLNVIPLVQHFDDNLPTQVDLIWSHDTFQYSRNPMGTLRAWNKNLRKNGTLVLSLVQDTNMLYNRFSDITSSGSYFHHTITSLIYMLGTCGFDCSKMYALKLYNDPWLQIVVRKSDIAPMDPETTTLYTLLEKGLLDKSAHASVLAYGVLRAQDLLLPWLDRNLYRIDYTNDPETMAKPTLPGPIFRQPSSDTSFLKR